MDHENSSTMQERLARIEFEYLYKEIHDNAEKVYAISHASIIATMAFFAFIAAADATKFFGIDIRGSYVLPVVFIVPLIIIIPSMVIITSRLNATVRCAMYIMCFYEKGPVPPCWQWALQEYRNCEEKGGKGRPDKEEMVMRRFLGKGLYWLLPVIAAICIVLSVISGLLIAGARLVSVMSVSLIGDTGRNVMVICAYGVVQVVLMIVVWGVAQEMRRAWATETFVKVRECWEDILSRTRPVAGGEAGDRNGV